MAARKDENTDWLAIVNDKADSTLGSPDRRVFAPHKGLIWEYVSGRLPELESGWREFESPFPDLKITARRQKMRMTPPLCERE
jgi:hypothetical protein